MRGNRIGELAVIVDLIDRAHDLRRDLLVELHVALELGHDRARQRLRLDFVDRIVGDRSGLGLEIAVAGDDSASLRARVAPSTSTFTVPSGSFNSCSTLASVPAENIASGAGSSSAAFFCVASNIGFSDLITSSSARIDFSRPTNSGTIMCGKTTMSRKRQNGIDVERARRDGFALAGHGCPCSGAGSRPAPLLALTMPTDMAALILSSWACRLCSPPVRWTGQDRNDNKGATVICAPSVSNAFRRRWPPCPALSSALNNTPQPARSARSA